MEEPEKLGISGWGEVTVTTVDVGVILKKKSIVSVLVCPADARRTNKEMQDLEE